MSSKFSATSFILAVGIKASFTLSEILKALLYKAVLVDVNLLIIVLKLLLETTLASLNKPIGDRSFKTLLTCFANATCCAFCACLAFVATKGNKPITEPAPFTKPDEDVENTFIGISYRLAISNMLALIGTMFPASSITSPT